MNVKRQFVLFDFDGVIADSYALSFELSRHFSPELDEHSYRALYEKNIFESLKKLGSWKETLPEEYQQKFDPRMKDEVRLVPGMEEVIATLHKTFMLGIISSTSQSGITDFLQRHGLLNFFPDILGRDTHHSKVEKMAMIFEKYGVSATDCIYITDTLGDMREAKEHGMATLGSSWGVHPRETLEKGVPFRIAQKPLDLIDAVEDYFSSAR